MTTSQVLTQDSNGTPIATGTLAKILGGTGTDNSTGITQNAFWGGPSGASGAANYRVLVAADLPASGASSGSYPATGQIPTLTISAGGVVTAVGSTTNGSALASLNASNLSSGTVPIGVIPTGTSSSTVTIGNDTRLPPAPTAAGKIIYDTGSAYAALAAGTSGQVLTAAGASAPTWSAPITNSNGSTALGSTFTLNSTSGTYQDTGLAVSLPAAGTYLLTAQARTSLVMVTGQAFINIKLFDSTAGADVANTIRMGVYANTTAVQWYDTTPISIIYTVSGTSTIKLYASRNSGTTYSTSQIVSDTFGYTTLSWVRLN